MTPLDPETAREFREADLLQEGSPACVCHEGLIWWKGTGAAWIWLPVATAEALRAGFSAELNPHSQAYASALSAALADHEHYHRQDVAA